MIWAHPLLLLLVPIALGAVGLLLRRARGAEAPVWSNIKRLWADRRGLSDRPAATSRRLFRGACLAAGASAALLALARPQWGEIAEPRYEQSREVMLALDLSRSMLADDVSPSRLARAKLLIESLLDQLKGERVGLIVFSGTAFVQSPLSADYEVLRDFLTELDPSYLPEGGTDYEAMLRTAAHAFGDQGGGDRYLVILSDGEALDENWKSLIPALRDGGIRVIGLGVGTPEGALVPDGDGGLVKDEHGAAVLSRLEPRTLQELAAQTGGTYRDAATWVDIAELVSATVEQGQKGYHVEPGNVRAQDRFQWFLAPAVLLFLLSYWLEFPVSPLARALPTRGRRPHPASAPAIAAALMGLAAWHSPRLASAAVPDASARSGTASQPNSLTATVAELSKQPDLSPADCARLATETIQFASQPNALQGPPRAGVIDDALAAVDRGEAGAPSAADWRALREQLERLKQTHQEPPQTQPEQANQDQQKEQGQNGQQGKPDQQNSGGGQPQPDQSGQGGSSQKSEQAQGSQSGTDQPVDASAADDAGKSDTGGATRKPAHGDPDTDAAAPPPPAADDHADSSEHPSDEPHAGAGEVQRAQDVKPMSAPEAGLGDQGDRKDQADAPDAAQAEPASPAPQQPSRMVGGGPALQGAAPQGDTALAEAIAKMERVKDGDAPAVLFDRMNRAEGQPRAEKHGKNW